MEDKLMPRIDLTGYTKDKYIIDLGNYEIKEEDGTIYMVRKKYQFPKTYEECCKILFPNSIAMGKVLTSGYNCELLKKFGELLICRDTYWKIIGEQWGLYNPWKPIYTDDTIKYSITTHKNRLDFNGTVEKNYVLIFPTKEIKNTFYENFNDLIESCKELL